jgi:hypothetical protein
LHENFQNELVESPGVSVVGSAVFVEFTKEQVEKYEPMEAKLNNLISQVIESLEGDVEYARRTTKNFPKWQNHTLEVIFQMSNLPRMETEQCSC